jgi:hypothetical protein
MGSFHTKINPRTSAPPHARFGGEGMNSRGSMHRTAPATAGNGAAARSHHLLTEEPVGPSRRLSSAARGAQAATPRHPRSAAAAAGRSSKPDGHGAVPRRPRTGNPNPAVTVPQPARGMGSRSTTHLVAGRIPPPTRVGRARIVGGEKRGRQSAVELVLTEGAARLVVAAAKRGEGDERGWQTYGCFFFLLDFFFFLVTLTP